MSTADEVEVPRVLRLLWGLEEPSRRGPKPGLSLDAIADAAVRLADAEGLAAVSMSRVAGELGFSTMSLYRYVDSKDDLLLVMANAGYGRPELRHGPRAAWRTRMEEWARAMRAGLAAHPWLLEIPVSEPPLAPNPLAWMEAGLQALSATPLREQEKLSAMLLTDTFVRGQTQLALQVDAAARRSGSTPQEADARYARVLGRLVTPETHPGLVGALSSGSLEDGGDDFADAEFAFGLKVVMEGIAGLVEARARRAGQATTR